MLNEQPAATLELVSQRQLSDASINGRAADHTERRRGEVGIRVGKLRMVQRIEKLCTKLKTALFEAPWEGYSLGDRQIKVSLSGTVDDPRGAVPEGGSNAIRPDNWRRRKTVGIEIATQIRLHRPSLDQLLFGADAAQLR